MSDLDIQVDRDGERWLAAEADDWKRRAESAEEVVKAARAYVDRVGHANALPWVLDSLGISAGTREGSDA